jgi:broad specificity phosphatase PhoE
MELLLIRHGECKVNKDGVITVDPYDPPLTERGWRQARMVGRRLAQRPVDVLYCGSLLRSLQTAQCIYEEAATVPNLIRCMYEVGYNLASREYALIRAEFPFVRLVEAIPDCQRDHQETLDETISRADLLLAWLRERHAHTGLTVGVVSHGTFNDIFLARCLGLGSCGFTRFSSGNCGIHWLEVKPDTLKFRKLNDECHIPESERT